MARIYGLLDWGTIGCVQWCVEDMECDTWGILSENYYRWRFYGEYGFVKIVVVLKYSELTLACIVVCARLYCNSHRVCWLHTLVY